MRLASPEKVLSLLGIGSNPGGVAAAEDALDASFSTIESIVESRLVLASVTDSFILRGEAYPSLRLTNGFLASDKVTVSTGDTAAYVLRKEGVVALPGTHTGTVTIKYSCGYSAGADGATLQGVDRALENAHAHLAASLMSLAPTAVSKSKASSMGNDAARGFEGKALRILQDLHRPRALVIWPTHSKG